jgi:hypothetical protein
MTPQRIAAVVIPRIWQSESDLRRLQGIDLIEMNDLELLRERRRLSTALGMASDAQLDAAMFVLPGAPALSVEMWLTNRLSAVEEILTRRGAP